MSFSEGRREGFITTLGWSLEDENDREVFEVHWFCEVRFVTFLRGLLGLAEGIKFGFQFPDVPRVGGVADWDGFWGKWELGGTLRVKGAEDDRGGVLRCSFGP